jgi:hypothetical protein
MVEESEAQYPVDSIESAASEPASTTVKDLVLEWLAGLTARAQDLS